MIKRKTGKKPAKPPLLWAFCIALFSYPAFAQNEAGTPGPVVGLPVVTAPRRPPAEADGDKADFEIFQNKSGGVTITLYRGNETDLVIPGEIGGQRVTVIGPRAFAGKGLRSVSVPEGVDTIAYCAFADNGLSSLRLPSTLVSIEYEAFAGNSLTALVLPENAASLGVRAFAENPLESLGLPGKLTYIGKDAFKGNVLKEITIAERRNVFTIQGFDLSFVNYYGSTGKTGGTYTKSERVWSLGE
ncbi:MAG: leucine-rich repeat domain-containing protein [Treponema sp.]|nr:leucine-rich repeat domain-containing protein [Treponema sp.]